MICVILTIFCGYKWALAMVDDVPLCVTTFLAQEKKQGPALGFAPSEVETIVADIARKISFQGVIKIAYCETYIRAVSAWHAEKQKDIPDGDYIVINKIWLREVVGNERTQAIALLGHELGHIANRHFESRSNIPRVIQETEADESAGCAVATLGGSLPQLEEFLYKVRPDSGTGDYPSRQVSVNAARKGYNNCVSRATQPNAIKAALKVAASPDTVGISPSGLTPVDYVFQELNGVGVQVESEDTQWFFLDGTPISPLTRFSRILGGSFPMSARGEGIYHNNIYLPPQEAEIAKTAKQQALQLRHWFNVRDENGNVLQVPATLLIYIQR